MTDSLDNPYKFNRVNIITKNKKTGEPSWDAFRRSQEKEAKVFREIRDSLKMQYNYANDSEVRENAGRELGYGLFRIAAHEYFQPLFQLYGKLSHK